MAGQTTHSYQSPGENGSLIMNETHDRFGKEEPTPTARGMSSHGRKDQLAGLPATSRPSISVRKAFTAFIDVAPGSSELAIHWAA